MCPQDRLQLDTAVMVPCPDGSGNVLLGKHMHVLVQDLLSVRWAALGLGLAWLKVSPGFSRDCRAGRCALERCQGWLLRWRT